MSTHATESLSVSGLSRLFGPCTDPQTYRNIVFLLVRLPLGIVYFSVFLTGLALGISLMPLIIGIPILGAVLGFADYVGVFEAAVFKRLLGVDITHSPVHNPTKEPLVPYLTAVLTDPWSYLLVGYFLASLFVGIGTFIFVVVVFSLGISLAIAPLAYPLPFTQYDAPHFDWAGGRVVVDTLPEALLVSIVGLMILLAGVHLANALATGYSRLMTALVRALNNR